MQVHIKLIVVYISDVSIESQCAFTAMLLKRANSRRVSQWTADTVDEINVQIEGDAMYVKAFDDDTIPDTERLSLTYLPDHVHWRTMTADPAKPKSARY